MKRFINKTTLKYAVAIFACVFAVVSGLVFTNHKAAAVVFAFAGLFYFVIQVWLIDIKKSIARVERTVNAAREDSLAWNDTLGLHAELLQRLNRKAVRNEGVVNNIAGTTGRMAPLVRGIKEATSSLNGRSGTTVAPKASGTKAVSGVSSELVTSFQQVGALDELVANQPNLAPLPVNVMVIADEFSLAAFDKEWNQLVPTKSNYRQLLDSEQIDLLFVESAWEANQGEWRYQLVGSSAPRTEIIDLVERCRSKGIPTVFWNKEDPPHYDDFIQTAKLFDYVFTTEARKVSEYKKELGHDRVGVLPFAAQPYYHNPARVSSFQRTGSSVFGGMYFREKYPERRAQMNFLLPAAGHYGLDIYSRNTKVEKYRFPETLEKFVVGSLTYPQMVAAYHAYKVVLNVNSVPDSESMCARRIFEASACGAAVVSPSTQAIRNFFPQDEITLVDTAEGAKNSIRALLRSDEYRDRKVHLAQRRIWNQHTYRHRARTILDFVGLWRTSFERGKAISVIIPTNRSKSLEYLWENISRQRNVKFELVIATHGFSMPDSVKSKLEASPNVERLQVLEPNTDRPLGAVLNSLVDASSGDIVVRMDDDDWYGPHYVEDIVNAVGFSGADLVGKAATYIYFESNNSTVLTLEGSEHRYTDFVRGATFAGPRKTFLRFRFPELGLSEDSTVLKDIKAAGGTIYAADRFNFVVNRFADKERHTWLADDMQLFSTGRMAFLGNGQDQLAV